MLWTILVPSGAACLFGIYDSIYTGPLFVGDPGRGRRPSSPLPPTNTGWGFGDLKTFGRIIEYEY